MSVTMKKPEATLGDTSIEASLLSNHIQKESTGNARRDSTTLLGYYRWSLQAMPSINVGTLWWSKEVIPLNSLENTQPWE